MKPGTHAAATSNAAHHRGFDVHSSHSLRRTSITMGISFGLLVALIPAIAADSSKGLPADARIFRDGAEEYLDLSGHAGFLEPLAGAVVTVSSPGGRTVQELSDASGNFQLRYELVGPGAPLEVRVLGVDGQSGQEYAAWLGDPPFLLARAGADRVLDQAELPALKVNAFQTGRYVAITALPPSDLTPTNAGPERLAASYNWFDAHYRSSMIALVAAGEVPLPVGAATTLEAVTNLAVAQPLYDEYNAFNYDLAQLYPIGSDPQHVPLLSEPPFGHTLQTYSTFSTYGSRNPSTRVRFEADGTGTLASGSFAEQDILWTDSPEGYFRLTAADGGSLAIVGAYYYYEDCGCQRLEEDHYVAARVGLAEGPRGKLLLAITWEQEKRFPEEPGRPAEPRPAYQPYALETALMDDAGLAAFDDPSGDVLWLQVAVEESGYYFTQGEPHSFAANGTGMALHRNLAFSWTLDGEGRLHITYANGAEATTTRASADREYGSTTIVLKTSWGAVHPEGGVHLRQEPDLDFSDFDPAGRTLLSQVNCDAPFAALEEVCRDDFGFAFAADHSGTMVGSSSTLEWEIGTEGELLIERYNPDGSLSQRREWTLVQVGPSSVLLFERIALPDGFELAARLVRYSF